MSPSPKTATELFEGFANSVIRAAIAAATGPITFITADSRQAAPGCLYVAVKGTQADGHAFIPEVASRKPSLIVGEQDPSLFKGMPYIQVSESRRVLGLLAASFHGHPSRTMKVVGVTGTAGKTTTTYLVESILRAAGLKVGVIGTVNFRFDGQVIPSTHTTPGAVELQALLAGMRDRGCQALVMEVSSHALAQERVAGLAFDVMAFLNLTPEHLDFHKDLEDYFQAKRLLFTEHMATAIMAEKAPVAVINAADAHGKRLLQELRPRAGSPIAFARVLGYGADPGCELPASGLSVGLAGIKGEAGGVSVDSALVGTFNGENILCAVGAGLGLGLEPGKIAQGVRDLRAVPGRLERVPDSGPLHVFVDYAHKPDALRQVLEVLRPLVQAEAGARLLTVFGCGGDRDRTKRPVMGKIAAERSDHVWLTSDNPRTEDPRRILEEIEGGMAGFANWTREPDRGRAIKLALLDARPGDVIVIAGKGHENYQILRDPGDPKKTVKVDFDDLEISRQILRRKG